MKTEREIREEVRAEFQARGPERANAESEAIERGVRAERERVAAIAALKVSAELEGLRTVCIAKGMTVEQTKDMLAAARVDAAGGHGGGAVMSAAEHYDFYNQQMAGGKKRDTAPAAQPRGDRIATQAEVFAVYDQQMAKGDRH